ncbi:MAG: hypothetical protein OEY24_00975 [Candidatus Bathyarchaeota archaeon]|nr:hypothetical protein [Candidatus Bathyarchaeota archaeon]MDH5494267.1 hypothetical protein [Candidatus Bathyarchaeota archaeon]
MLKGAENFAASISDASAKLFEQTVVDAFLDKLKAGIAVPAFPQFRDMNKMFLSTFEGLEKIKGGYIETGRLTLKSGYGRLPEVAAIERNAEKIHAQTGDPFQFRVCITGPYTLALFFPYKNSQTYGQLGRVLSEIIEKNVFATKQGKVALISIDEPLFGMVDDPLIDRGTEGREELLAAWESMMSDARNRNVETCIHLHCTSDDLFWAVKSLRVVESHVDDPLYEMKTTKQRLEREDKLLKASIAITDFDRLVREKLGSNASDDSVAEAWKNISNGTLNPEAFLEDVGVMKKRLVRIVGRFGVERVVLAGAECGLRGFPTYASAIHCLKRVSKAVESIAK